VADPPRLSGVEGSLALVRHGESTWIAEGRFQGRQDPPLSQAGTQQAALVAGRLLDPLASPALPLPSSAPIGIWHSPLRRAAATAAAIAAARDGGVPLVPDERLVELAQGEWEGLTHAQVTARFGEELAAWRVDPVHHHAPGGEPLLDAARRAHHALRPILEALAEGGAQREGSDPVLGYGSAARPARWAIVVAHDGILRLLLMTLLDVPLERYWAFPFELCAVTVLELRGPENRLRAHNLAEHLAPQGGPSLDTARPDGAL
jgi:broad specificity phosphatase PhoE